MNSDTKALWHDIHAGNAASDDIFVQMGKSGFSMQGFFLSLKDAAEPLELKPSDVLLDGGGGTGWMSIAFSPFVSRILLFDCVEEAVRKADENVRPFGNIVPYVDDLITLSRTKSMLMKENRSVDKAMFNSPLQYLSGMEEVETSFQNLFDILKREGRALYTLNPDLRKKDEHIASYDRLDWPEERKERALEMELKHRLWLDFDQLRTLALSIGFCDCHETPLCQQLWQSTHMFNFLLEK